MNKTQENKFNMLKTVETFLDDNQETVNIISELANHQQQFKSVCEQLSLKDEVKRTVRIGKSTRKYSEKGYIIRKALAVSGALYAYAKKTNNIELAQNADINLTNLQRRRDTELTGVLYTIKELAEQNLPALEAFGITTEKFNIFKEKILIYETAVGQSGVSSVLRSGAVREITELFREADELLTNIDKLVTGLAEEHHDFVKNYFVARSIKNLGIRYKKDNIAQSQPAPETGSTVPEVLK